MLWSAAIINRHVGVNQFLCTWAAQVKHSRKRRYCNRLFYCGVIIAIDATVGGRRQRRRRRGVLGNVRWSFLSRGDSAPDARRDIVTRRWPDVVRLRESSSWPAGGVVASQNEEALGRPPARPAGRRRTTTQHEIMKWDWWWLVVARSIRSTPAPRPRRRTDGAGDCRTTGKVWCGIVEFNVPLDTV